MGWRRHRVIYGDSCSRILLFDFLGLLGTFPSPLLSDEVGPFGVTKSTDFLYEVVFLRL